MQASRRAFRSAVRERAGGLCEVQTPWCPRRSHAGHHAHHVRQSSTGGDDDPGNGLYVCAMAHEWIHLNIAAARERGYLA